MTDETERVTQLWPKDLKTLVKERSGQRGITDFTIAAVQQHLGVAATFEDLEVQLNQTKQMVQVLADKIVLGGDSQDRLQSLVEFDFPAWIDTSGWPTAYAQLVHQRLGGDLRDEDGPDVPRDPNEDEPAAYVDESQIIRVRREPKTPEVAVGPPDVGERQGDVGSIPAPASTPAPAAAVPSPAPGPRDDLLAKVLEKTGQTLPSPLKYASEISGPHNHAWERTSGVLRCRCGAYIDESDPAYPNGIVRDDPEDSGAGDAPTDAAAPSVVSEPVEPAPELDHSHEPEDLIDGECWTCGYVAS